MPPSALMIQLAGHAGSGNTTIAHGLAADMMGLLLDLDTVKSALLESGVPWDLASRASYAVIYAIAEEAIARPGAVVLVDTPSYWPDIHRNLTSLADRAGARYVFVECEADETTRAARIAARTPRRSQIRTHGQPPPDAPSSLTAIHERPIYRPEGYSCLKIDTHQRVDIAALAAELRKHALAQP